MEKIRQQFKDMVTYLLKHDYTESDKELDELSETYTDSFMAGALNLAQQQVKNYDSLDNVIVSSYFKVTFHYDKSKEGRTVWTNEEKVFEVKSAEELDSKIKAYISEGRNSHTNRKYYMHHSKIEKL